MSLARRYVPILKSKQGEFRALRELTLPARSRLTPFFDVVQVPWDYAKDVPKKTLEQHLDRIAEQSAKSWGTTERIFFDTFDLDLHARTSAGDHAMVHLFSRLRELSVEAVPVVGLDRDASYIGAVRAICSEDSRGACIRLLRDDIENRSALALELARVLAELALSYQEADLLLDLRDLSAGTVASTATMVVRALQALPSLGSWRSLTLAASAFPGTLSAVKANTVDRLPRSELDLWEAVVAHPNVLRKPAFGDYAIAHPDMLNLDHRKITLGASIRYSIARDWLILRGESFKRSDYNQFYDLSRNLIGRPEYCGRSFSWGDDYITKNALETVGTGNLGTWRGIGTNHHLTLVGAQIANSNVT